MNSLFKTVTCCVSVDDTGNGGGLDNVSCIPDEALSCEDKIFVKDMIVSASIGVYEEEHLKKQDIIVNVEMDVVRNVNWRDDNIDNVVSYEDVVSEIKKLAGGEHINLVETFAERIAEFCLQDHRVKKVCVSVEKPDIYDFAKSVGTKIVRSR